MNYDEVAGDEEGEKKEKEMRQVAGGWCYFAIVKISPSPFSVPVCPVKRNLALNGNRGSSDHAGLLRRGPFLSSLGSQRSSTYLPGI